MFDINNTNIKETNNLVSSHQEYSQDDLWDKLNLSQQFAVCSLGQFGYQLSKIRHINHMTLAVLCVDDKVATVNEEGSITISPKSSPRH